MEQQIKVSDHVIDFCKNWGVDVQTISSEHFLQLIPNSRFNKNPYNNTGIYSTHNKKTIYVDSNDHITQNPIDDKVLHELAHIVMRMAPNFIDEFGSPYFSMWYKMMQYTNSKHNLLIDEGYYLSEFYKSKIESINSFTSELIQHNLIKETGEFTFYYHKVRPQKSWLNSKCQN